jgi:hypothetical protein
MRIFTKFAAGGVLAAAVCVAAAFNVVPNGENVSVYASRNPQRNEKAIETVGKSDLLYVVKEEGNFYNVVTKTGTSGWVEKRFVNEVFGFSNNYLDGNLGKQRASWGGCCSGRKTGSENNSSNYGENNNSQGYSEYNCH